MNEPIRVLKMDLDGSVTWQYEGRILRREPDSVVLEAFFSRPDLPFADTIFRRNDRFVETFYTDRWYNIFEIHDRDDDSVKGWYCNVGQPAVVAEGQVSYVDLALDLWVSPGGRQTVFDQEEFDALNLSTQDRSQALAALAQLKELFGSKKSPH